MAKKKLLMVGFGTMAKATFGGFDAANCPYDITVVKTTPMKPEDAKFPTHYFPNIAALPEGYKPDMVLFAVKPKVLDQVMAPVAEKLKGQSPLYVSMIASKPLTHYTKMLGKDAKVLRVMPNLPIHVGAGLTLTYASPNCTEEDIKKGSDIFAKQSQIIRCASEAEFDKFTVHTGCTPGFLFRFGALFQQALKETLPPGSNLSDVQLKEITAKLMEGVGRYAQQQHPEVSFEEMAQRVATPGGLTAAGLKEMGGFAATIQDAFAQAIRAATARGEEIAIESIKK